MTLHPFTYQGRVGYVDNELKVIIAPQYYRGGQFSEEGYATVKVDGTDWGVIDTQGRLQFSIRARYLTPVSEGFCFGFEDPPSDRIGMIFSVTGEVLVDRLGDALWFSEGLCPVRYYDASGHRYIDTRGKIALKDRYYRAYPFHDGIAMAEKWDDPEAGFIDRTGNWVIQPKFTELGLKFAEGLCYARVGKKTGFIDRSGKFAFTVPIFFATPFENGVAMILTNEDNNEWRIIDRRGNWVTRALPIYTSTGFSEGLAMVIVKKGGSDKYGFVDQSGNFVIEPVYDDAEDFANGYSRVILNGRDGLLDRQGNVVWSDELYNPN